MESEELDGVWTVVERRKPKPDTPVDPPKLESSPAHKLGASNKSDPNRVSWSGLSRDTASREKPVVLATQATPQKDSGPSAGQRGVLVLKTPLPPSDSSNAADWPDLAPRTSPSGDSPVISYSSVLRSAPRPSRPQPQLEQVRRMGRGGCCVL